MDNTKISKPHEPLPLVFNDETPEIVMWVCADCSQIHLEQQEATDCCKAD